MLHLFFNDCSYQESFPVKSILYCVFVKIFIFRIFLEKCSRQHILESIWNTLRRHRVKTYVCGNSVHLVCIFGCFFSHLTVRKIMHGAIKGSVSKFIIFQWASWVNISRHGYRRYIRMRKENMINQVASHICSIIFKPNEYNYVFFQISNGSYSVNWKRHFWHKFTLQTAILLIHVNSKTQRKGKEFTEKRTHRMLVQYEHVDTTTLFVVFPIIQYLQIQFTSVSTKSYITIVFLVYFQQECIPVGCAYRPLQWPSSVPGGGGLGV